MAQPSYFDRSLKALIQRVPRAFFRLAGADPGERPVVPGPVAVNLPELSSDDVFLVGKEDDPGRWAAQIEYQLQPDRRVLPDWFFKNAALARQLGIPVVLTVVYLRRGRRATFPDAYCVKGGGLENEYRFHAVRLWEHAGRIRSGDLPELAPLLVLCEDEPTEATLTHERELILGSTSHPESGPTCSPLR